MVRPRTYFDIAHGNEVLGRVIFELYSDSAPKTSENFRVLCTGEQGVSPISERPLYYKNSIIHRSIKDFMIQGGDFTKRNGTGGESIYGGPFPDEDLSLPLDSEGLLCMANKGPNTNNSQFFITLRPCPHLNGKHVVFGKVIRGYEVVQKIAELPTDEKDRPLTPVVVVNCGELELRRKSTASKDEVAPKAESRKESDEEALRKHRRHDSRSRSPDSLRKKKSKRRKHRKRSVSTPPSKDDHAAQSTDTLDHAPPQETEEEYDARLEREEKERLEAARRRELERIREQYEEQNTRNGVRFKGRGRMKYVDPELRRGADER
ncbi:hypothetical protein PUNSTDRAFT_92359 [Punctularia strigosozonata HHB-11173 SS5]|uniref:peptidylprolyl isomerase n=1 Tax=Punctularia strigosozonata (strain HHB-11173) TaxID=741275 RepID=R7S3C4_PUNST|nr:uncharacterized protein PUNSTDRAFT_92359 [Punctularia strigosozonata HHB-11173 SS5]EIN04910.1 hypothetical protein PUNSTDRAFT_92359 [Punctularia strigosozonata HHB-11173 SS5]